MTEENTQTSFDVVAEIKNAVAIIDHAADQGAYRGWAVINQVAAVRGRLLAFIEMMEVALKSHAEAAQDAESDTPGDDEPSTDATVINAEEIPASPESDAASLEEASSTEDQPDAIEDLRKQYAEAMLTLEKLRKQGFSGEETQ